jgi:tRNA dimethylallyltransferase
MTPPATPASADRAVVCLMGPTASGKTDLALTLCDVLAPARPVSLISVDSAMVYRGMDIGTAKPGRDVLTTYPHALIDVCDPAEPFSVGDFVRAAEAAVADALAAGRLPVLVGGTMLYFRAFKDGIARLPAIGAGVRDGLAARLTNVGLSALYDELARVDPEAARGIHRNNTQRILRALEVYYATGQPLSSFWRNAADAGPVARHGWQLHEFVLDLDRATLHERIETRFRAMLDNGFLDEVGRLKARPDLTVSLPALRAVGYRQVWNYLDGEGSYEHMCQRGISATRQLARRQLTWLRHWSGAKRISALEPGACRTILNYLEALAIVPTRTTRVPPDQGRHLS